MSPILTSHDAWTAALSQAHPRRVLDGLERYAHRIGSFSPEHDHVRLGDLRLAQEAFHRVGVAAQDCGDVARGHALRQRLEQWICEWSPRVASQLAREFVQYFATFEDRRKSIAPGPNNAKLVRANLAVDREGWEPAVEALGIMKSFAPGQSLGGGDELRFWESLAAWKKAAQSAGMPIDDVPQENIPLERTEPVGP